MDITLTTPALLFPTVSLLMLAYTNRFLTIATIIRNLHDRYRESQSDNLLGQIANLRYRVYLIRNMQIAGGPQKIRSHQLQRGRVAADIVTLSPRSA